LKTLHIYKLPASVKNRHNDHQQSKVTSIKNQHYTYSPLFHKLQIWNFAIVDIRIKIGIRLKELRNEKGLSQEKFSSICELDRTYIASIEQGKRNVSVANIEKIAKALDMSVYQFFKSDLFK
jgi:DNA-binding XRE family transcriptional regulator